MKIPYLLGFKTGFFHSLEWLEISKPVLWTFAIVLVLPFQDNPEDQDPSYKMDLDLWDCFGRKITLSHIQRNTVQGHNIFLPQKYYVFPELQSLQMARHGQQTKLWEAMDSYLHTVQTVTKLDFENVSTNTEKRLNNGCLKLDLAYLLSS